MKFSSLALFLVLLPGLSSSEVMLQNGVLIDRTLAGQKEEEGPSGSPLEKNPAGDDVLLLSEGNVLHGSYGGLMDGVIWERSDIERPIRFAFPNIRQIVRNHQPALKLGPDSSYLHLISGDRIPGKILSLDETTLSIQSEVLGKVEIPRSYLKSIAPNPFNGELFYIGPYTSDGWVVLNPTETEPDQEEEKEAKEEEEASKPSSWIHSGASFFSQDTRPLAFPKARLPDVGRLKFKLEWQGTLNLSVAFLSDFTRLRPAPQKAEEDAEKEKAEKDPPADLPEGKAPKDANAQEEEGKPQAEDDEEKAPEVELQEESLFDRIDGNHYQEVPWVDSSRSNFALAFGSGYTMTLYSSYPSLARNSFSEKGEPVVKQLRRARSSVSMNNTREAIIEFCYDREKGLVLLFINDEYSAQWNDLAGAPGDGTGFAFLNNQNDCRLRLSEVMVTSWNGMKDPASSMQLPDRDVALLVNGTDRFSGQLTKIEEGMAHFKTDYLDARLPLRDLSRIVLRSEKAEADDEEEIPSWGSEPVTILYQPYGKLSLYPESGGRNSIKGTSPFLGEIEADLSAASLLRFQRGSPDLSDWFDDL